VEVLPLKFNFFPKLWQEVWRKSNDNPKYRKCIQRLFLSESFIEFLDTLFQDERELFDNSIFYSFVCFFLPKVHQKILIDQKENVLTMIFSSLAADAQQLHALMDEEFEGICPRINGNLRALCLLLSVTSSADVKIPNVIEECVKKIMTRYEQYKSKQQEPSDTTVTETEDDSTENRSSAEESIICENIGTTQVSSEAQVSSEESTTCENIGTTRVSSPEITQELSNNTKTVQENAVVNTNKSENEPPYKKKKIEKLPDDSSCTENEEKPSSVDKKIKPSPSVTEEEASCSTSEKDEQEISSKREDSSCSSSRGSDVDDETLSSDSSEPEKQSTSRTEKNFLIDGKSNPKKGDLIKKACESLMGLLEKRKVISIEKSGVKAT